MCKGSSQEVYGMFWQCGLCGRCFPNTVWDQIHYAQDHPLHLPAPTAAEVEDLTAHAAQLEMGI